MSDVHCARRTRCNPLANHTKIVVGRARSFGASALRAFGAGLGYWGLTAKFLTNVGQTLRRVCGGHGLLADEEPGLATMSAGFRLWRPLCLWIARFVAVDLGNCAQRWPGAFTEETWPPRQQGDGGPEPVQACRSLPVRSRDSE